MIIVEARACNVFADVIHNFLGLEIVEELFLNLQEVRCRMSIESQYLHSRLSEFPNNLGDVNEEQGERFH